MAEGFALQASYKIGDHDQHMVNVRGEDPDEFERNLEAAEGLAESIAKTGSALAGVPTSTAQAVQTVQRELGGQVVADGQVFNLYPLGTGANSPREDALASKGFVPDKWHDGPDKGGFWHLEKFSQAPACQCSGQYKPNHTKLALKVAMSKAGKEYKAWTCPNTFGKSASAGCPNSFDGPWPTL